MKLIAYNADGDFAQPDGSWGRMPTAREWEVGDPPPDAAVFPEGTVGMHSPLVAFGHSVAEDCGDGDSIEAHAAESPDGTTTVTLITRGPNRLGVNALLEALRNS